jgi:hypothetical protein
MSSVVVVDFEADERPRSVEVACAESADEHKWL